MILACKDISKSYGTDVILEKITFNLEEKEKAAVVGVNGAGKTTLVKLICGFFDPTHGKVLLDSKDIREFNRQDYYAMFSAVFQNFSLLAGTIAANVAQTEENYDMERIKDCAEKAGLTSKINSLKDGYQTKLNRSVYEDGAELSGGEQKRVCIARALSVQPRCIIFDETTAGLDVVRRRQALDLVRSLQRERRFAALFVTHDLAVARYMADTLWVMKDGAIVDTLERPFSSQSIHHPYTALLMSEADLGITAP